MALFALFAVAGALIAAASARTLQDPKSRWAASQSRWMLFARARSGEAAPSASEIRMWAGVWFLVGLAVIGVGAVVGFAA